MTEIGAWLPSGTVLALGWALIHSLWQDLAIAALATLLTAFSRRPSTRYLIGVSALALMLVAAVATFLILIDGASFNIVSESAARPVQRFVAGSSPLAAQIRLVAVMSAAASSWPVSRIIPMLVKAWLFGVALFSLRLACGFLLLEQRRRWRSSPPAERFVNLCREVQDRLGLTRAVRYLECDWLHAPAVIGWVRPVVLLPVIALTGLSEDQLRAVVAHELAHIQRLDCVVNFLQALVEALFFYHPAVWWLGRRIRTEREHCCDEIATSLYDNRLEYARALRLMGEWRSAPLLAMAANGGPLCERILCVLGRESTPYRPRPAAFSAGLLFLMAILTLSRVMPGALFPRHPLKAGALVQAIVPQEALPHAEMTARVASDALEQSRRAVVMARQVARVPVKEVSPRQQTLLKRTHRVHADPLPVITEATLAVTQPQMTLASLAQDRPAPQAGPSTVAASVGNDGLLTDQPTGSGDPDALVCRQPERLPGSQTMGPRLCRKNTYWFELWIRGETLSADGKGVLEPAAAQAVDVTPDGVGDPDQVVCAKPQHQSASRLLTPTRCFRNAYWAQLNRNLPRDPVPTDTGHRFLAVMEYPIGVGPTAQ
jgi:beta-lactamase regulating signal transducer with metallopeptidase domain